MKQILAAGTVTIDRSGSKPKVLVVHRPCYDDWTIPKGKIEPDEFVPVTAYRETLEETAVRVRLSTPVDTITYPVGGGMKTVHYWRAEPLAIGRRKANKEVDKVTWLSPRHALKRLTYADERALVEQALDLPPTTPIAIVRHGKAMIRANWSGRDQARPINARGRKQAEDLVPLLTAFGVSLLASSTSTRCMQTLAPYEREIRGTTEGWAALSEEQAELSLAASAKVMRGIISRAVEEDRPAAICGHRPVLPTMLETVGVHPRALQPGALCIAHLDADLDVRAAQWIRPRR